jgi:TolA-binding protein
MTCGTICLMLTYFLINSYVTAADRGASSSPEWYNRREFNRLGPVRSVLVRRLIGSLLLIALVAAASVSAAEKDTPAAANTRKKLLVKISVEFEDEHLSECLKEIARQIEDTSGAKLSFFYDVGVSQNQRLTYSGKDQTVAEVLDGMLKKNSLGYIVYSKDKDRYDGFLKIKQGNERGYPAGEEPKAKVAAKALNNAKDAGSKTPQTDEERAEKTAAAKLEFARSLIKDGKVDRARQRLEDIIKQYPNTKAAADAKKELDQLGK